LTERASAADEMRCIDLVDEISAYLDGELDDVERSRIERHLEGCPGCQAAIDQFQTVIRLGGRLSAADVATIDPLIRDRLMGTLRVPRRR
jgi:anti-sigma factor (TIGR02949 family)